MDPKRWIIVLLVAVPAGWMVFDGARAFVAGDYITPKTGEYAGQLGPWANLVQAVGIDPRSTFMKSIFVIYGLLTLVIVVSFMRGVVWSRPAMILVCIFGLWYLPIGTVTNLIALFLLTFKRS